MAPSRVGVVLGHHGDPDVLVGENLGVDEVLHARRLFRGKRPVMGEIEPQSVRRHQRALLLDVITEHLAQRPVQQVGAGVIAPDGGPAVGVDRRRAASPGWISPLSITARWRITPGRA